MPKLNLAKRRRARRFALQAIYQWQLNPEQAQVIAEQFLVQEEMVSVDTEFFKTLLLGVSVHYPQLDEALKPLVAQSSSKLHQVEQAILRMGAYELYHCPETPYRVIVNEAIELTKAFSAPISHKYVNGILHKLAVQARPLEINTPKD